MSSGCCLFVFLGPAATLVAFRFANEVYGSFRVCETEGSGHVEVEY